MLRCVIVALGLSSSMPFEPIFAISPWRTNRLVASSASQGPPQRFRPAEDGRFGAHGARKGQQRWRPGGGRIRAGDARGWDPHPLATIEAQAGAPVFKTDSLVQDGLSCSRTLLLKKDSRVQGARAGAPDVFKTDRSGRVQGEHSCSRRILSRSRTLLFRTRRRGLLCSQDTASQ